MPDKVLTGSHDMRNQLLLGIWRFMIPIPQTFWQGQIRRNTMKVRRMLDFMSDKHHLVRNFVVEEIPRAGQSLSPEYIARHLNLSIDDVKIILNKLEKKLFFLFRNDQGEVAWAYPVTVDRTPHRISFSSGEELYAA
jgi:hypothetical protein